MSRWALVDTHPTQGRIFRRPLDVTELAFFWYGLFNGSTDTIQHYALRLTNGPQNAHLFSEENIVRAWLSTKRRYPLSGAVVQGSNGPLCLRKESESETNGGDSGGRGDETTQIASELHFVIREYDLTVHRPGEIVFGYVSCAEEVQREMAAILDSPRPLSEERLVRLYVFRETDPQRTEVLHLMILMAHCITDWIAGNSFARCLLDTLARHGGTDSEPVQIPLEDRLAMEIPSTELQPVYSRSFSLARRRWRRAVGIVIFQSRISKQQGGHTLPCRLTLSTPHVAARSGHVSTQLTQTQSTAVISNCRLQNITFGNAFLPLAQVAMTRVLYRRYLRSEITEEEWAYRRRQPYLSGGLLNLRPYLDKAWFERGGGGEFMLSVSFPFYQLPFMTLGHMEQQYQHGEHGQGRVLLNGAPPFSKLLTFDQFLHRAGLVTKQTTAFVNHPLFFEIVRAASLLYVEPIRLDALRWMNRDKGNGMQGMPDNLGNVLTATDIPMILAHGWSNSGDVKLILPSEYPLPPTHPLSPYAPAMHPAKAGYMTLPSTPSASGPPTITLEYTSTGLRPRPGELYLGAASWRGRLEIHVFYDGNVYEEGVVREWMDEVKDAVLWYLGRSHQVQGTGENRSGNIELDRDHVRAKL